MMNSFGPTRELKVLEITEIRLISVVLLTELV